MKRISITRSAIGALSIVATGLLAGGTASAQREHSISKRSEQKIVRTQPERKVERSSSRETHVFTENQSRNYKGDRTWRVNQKPNVTYGRSAEMIVTRPQGRDQQILSQQQKDQQLRKQQVRRQEVLQPSTNSNVWQQRNIRPNREYTASVPPRVQLDRSHQEKLQRDRWNQYDQRWRNWQNIERIRDQQLRQERRMSYLLYQQQYWNRIREDRLRLQQFRYYDNYYNNYRYSRGGTWYYTSQFGAQMLRDAVNNGYGAGYQAGRADRSDGWRYDPYNSYGYVDAAFGYDSYYVSMDEYNYYFRQGFTRGYEDGYYGRYRYGSYSNGRYSILGSLIGSILDVVLY